MVCAEEPLRSTITKFYEVKPRTLSSVTNEFSFHYQVDEEGIYFSAHILNPDNLANRSEENDRPFENEHIRIYIAPNKNSVNAYVFAINRQNVFYDGTYNAQTGENLDWNGRWQHHVENSLGRWTAIGFIPWNNFTFATQTPRQEIQLLVSKHSNNNRRILSSSSTHSGFTEFLSSFTTLNILTSNNQNVEIFPYYSFNHTLENDSNKHRVGGDLFWQRNQSETIDLTITPDFGQVEANDLVINFSAIETFFSEQRPFFTRNQSNYDVSAPENLILVHTPRIGGQSNIEDVGARDINAAGRYTKAMKWGTMSLLGASENDEKMLQGRDFLLARVKFNHEDSSFGLSSNLVETPSINRRSIVLGLDYFAQVSPTHSLSLGIINSNIRGANESSDVGLWLESNAEVNETHIHSISAFVYGEHLDISDVGYVQRINRKQFEYEYTYLVNDMNEIPLEEIAFNTEVEVKTNFKNEKLPLVWGLSTEMTTTKDDLFEFGIELFTFGKDDTLTRGFNSTNIDMGWLLEGVYESRELPFGQIALEAIYGSENWSGRFSELMMSFNTEIATDIFGEFVFEKYHSQSWLKWEAENQVNEYILDELTLDVRFDYKFSEKHELRLRLELIAGKAQGKQAYQIQTNGTRKETERTDDFSFSEAAFQFRYKYSLSQLTAVYLSYTFGGEFENEKSTLSHRTLISDAISAKNEHNLFFKIRWEM
ncbi:hypothetical protein GLIP_4262 [Aliiglaciecola lipolytica E3]|uniref:DUF5916 domain-containing protein n=1 Tax=Aliiglaciecola lipolytica E3 TaxID=1127673 RepID=K6YJU8_9ALTE|nr:hypothetical protein GLIP_4262 [Aliiglaciecola lipolytica E3]